MPNKKNCWPRVSCLLLPINTEPEITNLQYFIFRTSQVLPVEGNVQNIAWTPLTARWEIIVFYILQQADSAEHKGCEFQYLEWGGVVLFGGICRRCVKPHLMQFDCCRVMNVFPLQLLNTQSQHILQWAPTEHIFLVHEECKLECTTLSFLLLALHNAYIYLITKCNLFLFLNLSGIYRETKSSWRI